MAFAGICSALSALWPFLDKSAGISFNRRGHRGNRAEFKKVILTVQAGYNLQHHRFLLYGRDVLKVQRPVKGMSVAHHGHVSGDRHFTG